MQFSITDPVSHLMGRDQMINKDLSVWENITVPSLQQQPKPTKPPPRKRDRIETLYLKGDSRLRSKYNDLFENSDQSYFRCLDQQQLSFQIGKGGTVNVNYTTPSSKLGHQPRCETVQMKYPSASKQEQGAQEPREVVMSEQRTSLDKQTTITVEQRVDTMTQDRKSLGDVQQIPIQAMGEDAGLGQELANEYLDTAEKSEPQEEVSLNIDEQLKTNLNRFEIMNKIQSQIDSQYHLIKLGKYFQRVDQGTKMSTTPTSRLEMQSTYRPNQTLQQSQQQFIIGRKLTQNVSFNSNRIRQMKLNHLKNKKTAFTLGSSGQHFLFNQQPNSQMHSYKNSIERQEQTLSNQNLNQKGELCKKLNDPVKQFIHNNATDMKNIRFNQQSKQYKSKYMNLRTNNLPKAYPLTPQEKDTYLTPFSNRKNSVTNDSSFFQPHTNLMQYAEKPIKYHQTITEVSNKDMNDIGDMIQNMDLLSGGNGQGAGGGVMLEQQQQMLLEQRQKCIKSQQQQRQQKIIIPGSQLLQPVSGRIKTSPGRSRLAPPNPSKLQNSSLMRQNPQQRPFTQQQQNTSYYRTPSISVNNEAPITQTNNTDMRQGPSKIALNFLNSNQSKIKKTFLKNPINKKNVSMSKNDQTLRINKPIQSFYNHYQRPFTQDEKQRQLLTSNDKQSQDQQITQQKEYPKGTITPTVKQIQLKDQYEEIIEQQRSQELLQSGDRVNSETQIQCILDQLEQLEPLNLNVLHDSVRQDLLDQTQRSYDISSINNLTPKMSAGGTPIDENQANNIKLDQSLFSIAPKQPPLVNTTQNSLLTPSAPSKSKSSLKSISKAVEPTHATTLPSPRFKFSPLKDNEQQQLILSDQEKEDLKNKLKKAYQLSTYQKNLQTKPNAYDTSQLYQLLKMIQHLIGVREKQLNTITNQQQKIIYDKINNNSINNKVGGNQNLLQIYDQGLKDPNQQTNSNENLQQIKNEENKIDVKKKKSVQIAKHGSQKTVKTTSSLDGQDFANHSLFDQIGENQAKEKNKTAPFKSKTNRSPPNLHLQVRAESKESNHNTNSSFRNNQSTHRQVMSKSFRSKKGKQQESESSELALDKVNQGHDMKCDIVVSQRSRYEKNHDQVMENLQLNELAKFLTDDSFNPQLLKNMLDLDSNDLVNWEQIEDKEMLYMMYLQTKGLDIKGQPVDIPVDQELQYLIQRYLNRQILSPKHYKLQESSQGGIKNSVYLKMHDQKTKQYYPTQLRAFDAIEYGRYKCLQNQINIQQEIENFIVKTNGNTTDKIRGYDTRMDKQWQNLGSNPNKFDDELGLPSTQTDFLNIGKQEQKLDDLINLSCIEETSSTFQSGQNKQSKCLDIKGLKPDQPKNNVSSNKNQRKQSLVLKIDQKTIQAQQNQPQQNNLRLQSAAYQIESQHIMTEIKENSDYQRNMNITMNSFRNPDEPDSAQLASTAKKDYQQTSIQYTGREEASNILKELSIQDVLKSSIDNTSVVNPMNPLKLGLKLNQQQALQNNIIVQDEKSQQQNIRNLQQDSRKTSQRETIQEKVSSKRKYSMNLQEDSRMQNSGQYSQLQCWDKQSNNELTERIDELQFKQDQDQSNITGGEQEIQQTLDKYIWPQKNQNYDQINKQLSKLYILQGMIENKIQIIEYECELGEEKPQQQSQLKYMTKRDSKQLTTIQTTQSEDKDNEEKVKICFSTNQEAIQNYNLISTPASKTYEDSILESTQRADSQFNNITKLLNQIGDGDSKILQQPSPKATTQSSFRYYNFPAQIKQQTNHQSAITQEIINNQTKPVVIRSTQRNKSLVTRAQTRFKFLGLQQQQNNQQKEYFPQTFGNYQRENKYYNTKKYETKLLHKKEESRDKIDKIMKIIYNAESQLDQDSCMNTLPLGATEQSVTNTVTNRSPVDTEDIHQLNKQIKLSPKQQLKIIKLQNGDKQMNTISKEQKQLLQDQNECSNEETTSGKDQKQRFNYTHRYTPHKQILNQDLQHIKIDNQSRSKLTVRDITGLDNSELMIEQQHTEHLNEDNFSIMQLTTE